MRSLFLLLLLRFLHVCLLKVGTIRITLDFPFASLVLLKLTLCKQVVEKFFGLKGLLRLSLLKFELLLELFVLLLQLCCSFVFAQVFFLQFSQLRSRSSALRTNLEHMNAFPVGC